MIQQSSSVMIITHRKLIAGTAAMTLLAGCKPHAVNAVADLIRGVNKIGGYWEERGFGWFAGV
jgi:hypothetical protein